MYYSIIINYSEEGSHNKLRVVRNIGSHNKKQLLSLLFSEINMDDSQDNLHMFNSPTEHHSEDNSWADFLDEESLSH